MPLADSLVPSPEVRRRQYARAPIVEAVVDIRCTLPDSKTLATLDDFATALTGRYPQRVPIAQGDFQVDASGATPVISGSQQQVGVLLTNPKVEAMQARLNGLGYSKLAPYSRWEDVRDEFQRLWALYSAALEPESVTRLGMRYINRLDLPLPVVDLKDYLLTLPDISSSMNQLLSAYVMQLNMPQPDLPGVDVVLRQATVGSPDPQFVSILLDIDVFKPYDVPTSHADLWSELEVLHMRLNRVFESSITDKLRELIA